MASPGKGARVKGHNFEREVAKLLSEEFGREFKRGLGQARNGGSENSDVICDDLPWLHIECKRHKKCNIKEAIRQGKDDIQKSGEKRTLVVITKDDREEMLVTMTYKDWVEMVQLKVPLLAGEIFDGTLTNPKLAEMENEALQREGNN